MEVELSVNRNGHQYRPMQETIPIEYVAEVMRIFYPDMLYCLSTEEICAIDRGNIERAVEIIEKYGLIEDIASRMSNDMMENNGIYVVEKEISRIDDDMIIDFFCLPDSE